MSTTPPPPPSSPPWFGNASLYVGDLEESVTEGQLYHLFSGVATVVSVRVCRDHFSKVSLGYGYVNFKSAQDASKAMEILNFTSVNGKPIRIMLSHPDPRIWESERANVFIKNLDVSIDNKALHDMFAAFGVVLSCKVATDSNGQPKGYGFVQFEKEESAQNAIKTLNGTLIRDKQVYVCLFVRRQKRSQGNGSPKFTNVYVKHFCETTSDEDLEKVFGKYGLITSAVVMRDADGKSRGFGFVNFQNPENAALAVEKLNGTVVDDRVWYVAKARRKAEREAVLGANLEQGGNGKLEKSERANFCLKNESVTDQSFKGQFSEYITSCKVVLDPQGQSRASGFVAFSTHGEANKVAHFAQLQTPIGMSYLPSIMPGYHLGGHWLALQQLYYGQRPLNFLPQFAYGFQQQQLPAIWPGAVPKYIVPYPTQQQDGEEGERVETVYKQGMVKTELCKNWEAMGTCTYGNRCQYAHGIQELRPVIRHPLYKTKICRMISCGRTCAYGPRCHYLHSLGSDGRKEEKMEESLNLEPGSDEEHEGEYHPEQLSSDAFDHQSSQVTQMPNTTTQVPSPVELPSPDVCEQDSNLNMPHQLFDRGRTQQCTINQQENIVSRVNRRTGTHTRLDVLRESSLSSHTLQQQPLVSAATAY